MITFEDGLRLVHAQMEGVRSVAIGVMTGAGSGNETPENNGISHFIEHMYFKGTKTLVLRYRKTDRRSGRADQRIYRQTGDLLLYDMRGRRERKVCGDTVGHTVRFDVRPGGDGA